MREMHLILLFFCWESELSSTLILFSWWLVHSSMSITPFRFSSVVLSGLTMSQAFTLSCLFDFYVLPNYQQHQWKGMQPFYNFIWVVCVIKFGFNQWKHWLTDSCLPLLVHLSGVLSLLTLCSILQTQLDTHSYCQTVLKKCLKKASWLFVQQLIDKVYVLQVTSSGWVIMTGTEEKSINDAKVWYRRLLGGVNGSFQYRVFT